MSMRKFGDSTKILWTIECAGGGRRFFSQQINDAGRVEMILLEYGGQWRFFGEEISE